MIRISIITPNFNSEKYIYETYQSLINQTFSNWEWLIIDDGSTDQSPELIKQWTIKDSRIKFYQRKIPVKKGASACRNIGIEKSEGDFIIFLDADDILHPNCIEQRIKYMQQNQNLDFAVFKMRHFKNDISENLGLVNQYHTKTNDYLKAFIQYNTPWQTTCPIWKKSFINNNNIRFSEKYQRLQDPEFHTKILLQHKSNFNVIKDAEVDCYYRIGQPAKQIISKKSFDNICNGFSYYFNDISSLLTKQNALNEHSEDLYLFTINSLHTLLFQYRLNLKTNPLKYYNKFKNMSCNQIHTSSYTITMFYIFNLMRLTFIKGLGISRAWAYLTNK